jgi:two-component system cell cycle sensor histidine kinase/response regulator CckA
VGPTLWERLRSGTATVHMESVHRRKNGDLFPVEISSTYVRFGQREYLCGFARDITDRKRAEQALRESEERWRALFENAPVVIGTLDRRGEVLSLNRSRGAAGEPAVGQIAYASAGAETQARFQAGLAAVFEGHPVAFELEYVAPHGGRGVDYVSLAPIHHDAGVAAAILVALDVTERTRAEEEKNRLQAQLIQAQKMEAVGRLAGGVAHDFNNLLTAILGYSELALVNLDQAGSSAQSLVGIRDVVQQAKALTQQILAFSRRQVLTMTVVDLTAELLAVAKMLSRLIGEHIVVETRLESSLGHVRADSFQLRQVLFNLAINARDAMPQGGRLTLGTGNVSLPDDVAQNLRDTPRGEYVLLTVSDTGTGMDAATQSHLFEPFFTTKDPGRGTGLGLATVYGIVKQHGGHIDVRSAPGSGTQFRILLPCVTDELRKGGGVSALASVGRGGETILVVEDEPAVRELTAQGLSANGYQVLSAASPAEALDLARGHARPLDLLLTDVVMPGMNGRELYDRLASERPGLRVLFMSGYAGDAFAPQGGLIEEGRHFIQKPFSLAELSRQMRQILDSET